MKKIFYFNPNVSSAIEQAGDIFLSWLNEIGGIEVNNYKHQSQSYEAFKDLMEFKPDIIILNEKYQKTVEASMFYKLANPDVKILFICHVWRYLDIKIDDTNVTDQNIDKLYSDIKFKRFMSFLVDDTVILNYAPENNLNALLNNTNKKVFNGYYPTNPDIFKNSVKWNERPNNFVYVGNLLPHKMSVDFIKKIKNTDIKIDCYGSQDFDVRNPAYKEYYDLIKSTPNLILKGYHPFDKISELFNDYKFFVLPHDGYEPFNWTLLQSIFCGTIPLVTNDTSSNRFDVSWINWADGMYLGTKTADDLILNMKMIVDENPDFGDLSEKISFDANLKFSYTEIKKYFINAVTEYISFDGSVKNPVILPIDKFTDDDKRYSIAEDGSRCGLYNSVHDLQQELP